MRFKIDVVDLTGVRGSHLDGAFEDSYIFMNDGDRWRGIGHGKKQEKP